MNFLLSKQSINKICTTHQVLSSRKIRNYVGHQFSSPIGAWLGHQVSSPMLSWVGHPVSSPIGAWVGHQVSSPMVSWVGHQVSCQIQLIIVCGHEGFPFLIGQYCTTASKCCGQCERGWNNIFRVRRRLGGSPRVVFDGWDGTTHLMYPNFIF